MFFVWFDGDRKRQPHLKLKDALAEYQAKYGIVPLVCLTSAADAAAIGEKGSAFDFRIQPVPFVAVNTFYLGGQDAQAALSQLDLPAVELREAA
ncbi:MAG: hypothetical protein M3440_02990 [Chloroflexota bacterium]|nr:hypothetical protein [Chloroflexota bacterium]